MYRLPGRSKLSDLVVIIVNDDANKLLPTPTPVRGKCRYIVTCTIKRYSGYPRTVTIGTMTDYYDKPSVPDEKFNLSTMFSEV